MSYRGSTKIGFTANEITPLSNASNEDWQCWFLYSKGNSIEEIADKADVSKASVRRRITRVDEDIRAAKIRNANQRQPPRLIPCFGSSNKAFATMTCADVHPCQDCDGAACERCGGTGVRPLDDDRSPFFCPVCDRSGWDDLPAMWPVPMPSPESEIINQGG